MPESFFKPPSKSKKLAECKGLFYRYTEEVYLNKKGAFVTTTKWMPLKRKSCKGCMVCGGYAIEDEVKATSAQDTEIHCENPTHGKVYLAIAIDKDIDYETGLADGMYFHMVEVRGTVPD